MIKIIVEDAKYKISSNPIIVEVTGKIIPNNASSTSKKGTFNLGSRDGMSRLVLLISWPEY